MAFARDEDAFSIDDFVAAVRRRIAERTGGKSTVRERLSSAGSFTLAALQRFDATQLVALATLLALVALIFATLLYVLISKPSAALDGRPIAEPAKLDAVPE